jgi:hypothetical protein
MARRMMPVTVRASLFSVLLLSSMKESNKANLDHEIAVYEGTRVEIVVLLLSSTRNPYNPHLPDSL